MENNLYYTPTLKDLHYGFEFEYKSKDDNWVKVTLDTWNRPSKENHLKYFTEHDLLRTLNHQDMACNYEDLTCIRVKYLDQSDIESLGWRFGTNDYVFPENKNVTYGQYKLLFNNNELEIIHLSGTLFRGIIKNKSELNKLMQQLNIK